MTDHAEPSREEGVTHRPLPTNARLLPDGRIIGILVFIVTLYRISIAIYRMSILYIVSLWLSIDFLYFFESFYIEYLLTFIELRGIMMAKY